MDCRQIEENYESYVLGALESDVKDLMSDHIDGCPHCTDRVREDSEAVMQLALAVPQQAPPPHVKARLLERIEAGDLGVAPRPEPSFQGTDWTAVLSGFGRRLVSNYGLAAASVAVVTLVTGGMWYNSKLDQVASEQDELATKISTMSEDESEMKEMVKDQRSLAYWAARPDVSVKRLSATNVTDRAYGMVMVSGSGNTAMLSALDLIPLPGDKVYQVWLIDERLVYDAGTFTVDSTGYAQMLFELAVPLSEIDRIVITVEDAGNNAGPKGESVLKVDL